MNIYELVSLRNKKQNIHQKNIIKEAGFTLIELLVVISIIALLSSVVLASLNTARSKARDSKRMADLKQVQIGLALYYTDHGKYPREVACDSSLGSGSPCPSSGTGWNKNSDFYKDFVGGGYMPDLPIDPINNSTYYYYYEPNGQEYYFRARLESGEFWAVCGGGSNASWCQ